MKRSCGILMPITALPSPYGIGTLGQAAFSFVDFLADAGQSWWQLLPVGHTSFGDSPYQCFSTCAGNPYLVDLDLLCRDGLLKPEELRSVSWGDDPQKVDYAAIYANRFSLLQLACQRGWETEQKAIAAFCRERGARLVLFSSPSPVNWSWIRHNSVEALAQRLEIPYLDTNLMPEQIPINWQQDTRDHGDHLNHAGAEKVSVYLGQYLAETGLFSDKRTQETYALWNEALADFQKNALHME